MEVWEQGRFLRPLGLAFYDEVGRVVVPVDYALYGGHVLGVEEHGALEVQAYLVLPRYAYHDQRDEVPGVFGAERRGLGFFERHRIAGPDRKSTRLNSSHHSISYAVFCLKKKK